MAACRALDFIEADAQCIASAWQAQTERTGRFDASAWPCEPQDFGLRSSAVNSSEALQWQLPQGKDDATTGVAHHDSAGPSVDGFAPCPKQLGLYAVLPDAAWVGRMARAGVPTLQLRFKSDDAVAVAREVAPAVYATTLKHMATPPQGPARLKMYARLLRQHATVAIGGIDATRLPEVLASGVGSVAVVRALVAAEQPEVHAAELQIVGRTSQSLSRKPGANRLE